MHVQPRFFPRILSGCLFAVLPLASMAESPAISRSGNIVIDQPVSLPAPAQEQGTAFTLYAESGDGNCYLYIEQREGKRLLVLNVTDPQHIKAFATVNLDVPGPFDFVRTIGSSALLVQYRNQPGLALLDVRKPANPVLIAAGNLGDGRFTEPLGDSALIIANQPMRLAAAPPKNYEVVDTSDPIRPTLLLTVKQVTAEITREETGTTFLLGSEGLTIIRHPRIEQKYKLEETYSN